MVAKGLIEAAINASPARTRATAVAFADSLPPGNSRSKLLGAAVRVEGPGVRLPFDDAATDLLSTSPAKLRCAR